VPQEVLGALQVAVGLGGVGDPRRVVVLVLAGGRGREGAGHLAQDGQAHGDVEPVDVVLGLGVEVAGDVADVLAAVGEEHDLLVVLHPLGAQQLVQAPLGLVVVGLDPGERLGRAAAGRGAGSGDGLEPV
jgi:hypothetical protein